MIEFKVKSPYPDVNCESMHKILFNDGTYVLYANGNPIPHIYIEPTENFYTEWKPKVFYSKRYFKWTYEQWKAKYCKEDYP